METVTLYFTRQFTGGLLDGARHHDSMTFATVALAMDWLKAARKGFKAHRATGNQGYRVTDAAFQKYTR